MNILDGEEESKSTNHSFAAAIGTARAAESHTSVIPQKLMSLQMDPVAHEDSYRRALEFLKANEPEKRLDIRLSPNSFRLLVEQAHTLYGDTRYPRVQYSAVDSRVIINTVPTALHSRSAAGLQALMWESVRTTLKRLNKGELCKRVIPIGDSEYSIVDDEGRTSIKTPDGGLTYVSDEGNSALTFIIEAGVSEAYEQLRRDIKLWLNQFESHTAMLMYLAEDPNFRNPTHGTSSTCSATECGIFETAMSRTWRVSPFGPYCFRGHAWFGTLALASVEIFKKDSSTSRIKTKKHRVVVNGQMTVEGDYVDVGLTVGDYFPANHVATEDIRAEPVLIETDSLREILASGALDTAKTRFYKSFDKRN
ncbi:hypothetical protein V1525DRAFT_442940 [Lipomyces kononenkoae]|uniref:Uncharacterized protein n=1 Tax=Lipomyces kononenkoae TaxID=34357 RepID=A0ACC3SZU7_LIPKO